MARKSRPDLFGQPLPDGLVYRENVLDPLRAENLIARFGDLPFQPFEFHGYLGNRRIVSYGGRYAYAGGATREAPPVPEFLQDLRLIAGKLASLEPARFAQVLVTEYARGAGIGWH